MRSGKWNSLGEGKVMGCVLVITSFVTYFHFFHICISVMCSWAHGRLHLRKLSVATWLVLPMKYEQKRHLYCWEEASKIQSTNSLSHSLPHAVEANDVAEGGGPVCLGPWPTMKNRSHWPGVGMKYGRVVILGCLKAWRLRSCLLRIVKRILVDTEPLVWTIPRDLGCYLTGYSKLQRGFKLGLCICACFANPKSRPQPNKSSGFYVLDGIC